MIDTGLNGKMVIVTGANHGIGAAIAIAFAREMARVIVTLLRQPPELYGETQANLDRATTPDRAYYCRETGESAGWVIVLRKNLFQGLMFKSVKSRRRILCWSNNYCTR